MSDIDTSKSYNDLEATVRAALERREDVPRDFGYLGYEIVQGTGITVLSPSDPANKYLVRMMDGGFKEIPHRSKVAPVPNLPVEIRYINNDRTLDREGYIYGVNEAEAAQFTSVASALNNIGPHSHHRGSGMEFPIDLRLIWPLSGRFTNSMIVTVQAGFIHTSEGFKYFGGGQVDLTTNRPSSTSYKRWAIISINADTLALSVTNGTAVASIVSLTESALEDIILDSDEIPLMGVKLYQNRNRLTEFDFVALYNIASNMAGYALAEHTHDASDIVSGVFDIARIPALPYMVDFDIAGDTGTGTITDGEELEVVGTGGITTTVTGNSITVDGSGIVSDTVVTETEIDFGASAVYVKKFTITDAAIVGTDLIIAAQSAEAATGKEEDENELDGLILRAVAGTGQFTLYASGHPGPVKGKFKINYLVGVP